MKDGVHVVEVTGVKINGAAVAFDSAFNASDDCWNGMEITAKNITKKTITFLDLGIILDSDINSHALNRYELRYGVDTGYPGTKPTIMIPPDGTVTITVSATQAAALKELRAKSAPNLARVRISVERVVFNDDTAWRYGLMMKRDPDDPKRWVPVSGTSLPEKRNIPSTPKGVLDVKSSNDTWQSALLAPQKLHDFSFMPTSGGSLIPRPKKASTQLYCGYFLYSYYEPCPSSSEGCSSYQEVWYVGYCLGPYEVTQAFSSCYLYPEEISCDPEPQDGHTWDYGYCPPC